MICADPDPVAQKHADPDPQPCYILYQGLLEEYGHITLPLVGYCQLKFGILLGQIIVDLSSDQPESLVAAS